MRRILATLAGGALALQALGVSAEPIPLQEAMATMEPPAVWRHFQSLTQIPRPSHHEERVSAFLAAFGLNLGLETSVDAVGNVLIRKPATPGMETRPGILLQAHMDMVPQKTPDKVHDFETDPIEAFVVDGWVVADRTTLGADDGIGVAMIMALLEDQTLVHGPLEAFFTVNEEDGMTGAHAVTPDLFRSRLLINVDSEEEGVFTIGSAGGLSAKFEGYYRQQRPAFNHVPFEIAIRGLQGGHSGVDIDKGLGNAALLMTRLLWGALWNEPHSLDLRLASLEGGDRDNSIPREATAVVLARPAQEHDLLDFVQHFEDTVRSELAAVEPDLTIEVQASGAEVRSMLPVELQFQLLAALQAMPNGVLRMSDSVPGLVETSSNLGVLSIGDGQFALGARIRSSVDSAIEDVAERMNAVAYLAQLPIELSDFYPGWRPNPDSPLLALMQDSHERLFGQPAQVIAIHAGLETGVIGAQYPDMDMISLGPNLLYVHTPNERLEVASVGSVYRLLVDALKTAAEDTCGSCWALPNVSMAASRP